MPQNDSFETLAPTDAYRWFRTERTDIPTIKVEDTGDRYCLQRCYLSSTGKQVWEDQEGFK